jgi:rhodanese-related sulfurtransferase
VKRVLLEAVLVAGMGTAVALVANALSPRGLKLTRDYFPGSNRPELLALPATNSAKGVEGAGPAHPSAAEMALARLKDKGLQVVDCKRAQELHREPGFAQGTIVFIDARNGEHYQQGHIPGAWQFDRYHPENYLAAVLPVCQLAQQVVVYCAGGDCEDSEFAALFLRDSAQVPGEKLFVFTGGWNEWTERGLPVETGSRNSGQRGVSK